MKKKTHYTSPLFVPGHKPHLFEKALRSGANEIILDMEDAVPESHKAEARSCIADFLGSGGHAAVRINAVNTADFERDIEALSRAMPQAVMVPKFENRAVADRIRRSIGADVPIIALIETAVGLINLPELGRAEIQQAAIGTLDLAHDLGCLPDAEPILAARVQIVIYSRYAEIAPPLDGVTVDFKDPNKTSSDARAARAMGFGGKLCIHPTQVAPVREAFLPTAEEVDWAIRVLALKEDGLGVVDGEMIDAPVILRAERILAQSRQADTA